MLQANQGRLRVCALLIGNDGFAAFLSDALQREVMTQREVEQALAAHEFIRSQR